LEASTDKDELKELAAEEALAETDEAEALNGGQR
jgi:hypothetical protein